MVFRSTYLIPTTVSTVERTGGILVPATLNSLARVNPAAAAAAATAGLTKNSSSFLRVDSLFDIGGVSYAFLTQ